MALKEYDVHVDGRFVGTMKIDESVEPSTIAKAVLKGVDGVFVDPKSSFGGSVVKGGRVRRTQG